MTAKAEEVRREVREGYGKIAATSASCCASSLYSKEELEKVPLGAELGLGSGNPVRDAKLRRGEVLVDLGSGAGIDVFLAADRVGPDGRAIGVDMTPEMVKRARGLARANGIRNVEFHESLIETLPLADGVADVVVSNCVINLSPDKAQVFREAFRVLKPGGRLVISDLVKEKPFNLDDVCGCVGGAMVRGDYLAAIRSAGFQHLEVLKDRRWPTGRADMPASSITVRAWKPKEVSR